MARTARDYIVKLPDGRELGPYPGKKNAGQLARAELGRGRLPNGSEIVEADAPPEVEPFDGRFAVQVPEGEAPMGGRHPVQVVEVDTDRVRGTRPNLAVAERQRDEWNAGGERIFRANDKGEPVVHH